MNEACISLQYREFSSQVLDMTLVTEEIVSLLQGISRNRIDLEEKAFHCIKIDTEVGFSSNLSPCVDPTPIQNRIARMDATFLDIRDMLRELSGLESVPACRMGNPRE